MNVASIELCKELHKLSGWEHPLDQGPFYCIDMATDKITIFSGFGPLKYSVLENQYMEQAYDLGFLLRKFERLKGDQFIHKCDTEPVKYLAIDEHTKVSASADTPEDAACKLAIELFKQGTLKV